MSFEDKKIAFIGAGAMGGAMMSGLVNSQLVAPQQITAADINEVRGQEVFSGPRRPTPPKRRAKSLRRRKWTW